jgi:hypothetical protein
MLQVEQQGGREGGREGGMGWMDGWMDGRTDRQIDSAQQIKHRDNFTFFNKSCKKRETLQA